MSNRRKTHLDALEARLTGPKRIALFGHRNVGKTTLLAMFYRQASTGQVPGVRLAAVDPASAEYLAEKIAQIESGEPPAGTLAETELKLRLYHGPARFDLIFKDYQGEHVTLGSQEPIREFFADCDAVLLCLDPDGSTQPAERRRRQQEVEELLERYIEKSDDGTVGRPVALLLTKFDRILARGEAGQGLDQVERLVEARYGMTRHLLARHVPDGAMFAVSSYGRGSVDGRPPAELHPLGLEGPLCWLAERLEAVDRDQLEWLWDLAPDDLPRLARCVAAYEKRYPRSDRSADFRRRLAEGRRRRRRKLVVRGTLAAGAIVAGLAGYDAWGYRNALAFERDTPPQAVARHWEQLATWHPTLPLFWPKSAVDARFKAAEWKVKATQARILAGTAPPDAGEKLAPLKDQVPELVDRIREVEAAQERERQEKRWQAVKSEAAGAADEPDAPLMAIKGFLREFPDTQHRAEAEALLNSLKGKVETRQSGRERQIIDDMIRSASLPNASFPDLIDQARQFMAEHPDSRYQPEVARLLEGYVKTLDDRDIEKAREFSRRNPNEFARRIERYDEYLRAHRNGGRYISEATEAKDRVLRAWDVADYRRGYDHFIAHPNDVAEVARILREYLRHHPDGQHAADANRYLAWWDKVSVPNDYRVTLRRGEFDPKLGTAFGGAPDLGVTLEVAGISYGPSPVIRNNFKPIWDYTFSRPIRWKLGDPVVVRVMAHGFWSDSPAVILSSKKGDPLAMKMLSGTIRPTKGGTTTLVFESDFPLPSLPKPGP
ncbi:TRAFAC clade GTPase domain-containing protein [Tundrisphaera sp. TA3]|uniref:TRAFAC clade GTPase domain-containing protein n=1 Tax=Tundrisphaera sp. TA3 TaxID=3435775 RepID=UPI003EBCF61E